ncbi:CNH domain-containing protein [Halteromyces radiatus]|uniref:CNH domain-containing protein n=1 Tax=Halteromyces radiatus TaxID=101107 RepID=UPI002220BF02|nr:CNH domain-containing protein [Halteromyces radiatus]KAI8081492.1 CNH domain-containing protein [Halteromyces radiatus]
MTTQTRLTPSASIREQYYRKHGIQQRSHGNTNSPTEHLNYPLRDEVEEDDNEFDYRPEGAIAFAPLKLPDFPSINTDEISLLSRHTEYDTEDDDAATRSIISLQTMDSLRIGNNDSGHSTLPSTSSGFGPSPHSVNTQQSRNLLQRQQSSQTLCVPSSTMDHKGNTKPSWQKSSSNEKVSLLSRLSKTTAPMRARLSAMSRTSNYLKSEMVASLSIPLRRSAESVYNLPTTAALRITGRRSQGERAQSFSFEKSVRPSREMITSSSNHSTSSSSKDSTSLVYAALLSEVATAFKERVTVGTKIKDSIKYKDTFDGVEAVDKLAFLTKTKDRNLALLLGRALDAQKFFHDVNYEHRLRDSRQELYRFTERINVRHSQLPSMTDEGISTSFKPDSVTNGEEDDISEVNYPALQQTTDDHHPNGVFTLLTNCYSPTCTREKLCYSVFCPRRLEQQARNSNRKTVHRTSSKSSLIEKKDRLWASTVSKFVVDKLSKEDRKRQENIFEFIYTEKDFVDDLAYVKTHWIQPLLTDDIIQPADRRESLVRDIFWNIMEVYDANKQFVEALQQRQKASPVVYQVGDIILQYVAHFTPFVQYGAHQIIGKSIFETEKSTNPEFAAFVQATERLPVSRKLELNGYLTKPTTRLGRYSLLLREILKHTPKDHPDQETIPKAMKIIAEHLSNVNHETGKTENRFNLQLLAEKLQDSSYLADMDLDLLNENRQIVMKGPLKRKGTGSESLALQVYLLDHCLIITKQKFVGDVEQFKLYRKPIPIGLLAISLPDQTKRASVILPYGQHKTSDSISSIDLSALANTSNNNGGVSTTATGGAKSGYPISFVHLGRHGASPITLYASTFTSRRQWVDKIESYRYAVMEKQKVFQVVPINNDFFNGFNKVNCASTYGDSIIIGGDQGVYLTTGGKNNKKVVRLLAMDKVSQIDILENKFILVLADKTLYTYSMESLLNKENNNDDGMDDDVLDRKPTTKDESSDDNTTARRGRKISSHVSFFKVGKVMDKSEGQAGVERSLVCYVRYNAMTSTIRALEVHDSTTAKNKKKKQQSIRRKTKQLGTLLRHQHEGLRVFKDLYIPGEATSIQYFKNVLCIGSAKGFQMVDVGSAGVLSVLDPSDESHNVLASRYDLRPISMFRHPNGNILLCYNDLAFYIDKKGRRVRQDWMMRWEGHPTAFAFRYPYIVAFDSSFVEIRHIDTGHIVQIIPGNNIRCLKPDPLDAIHCVMEDGVSGNELVFQLKFIEK